MFSQMLSNGRFDTPHLHRWRQTAAAVGTFVAVAILTFFNSAIALVVLFGALLLFAAHAIASGGKPRPTEPTSQPERDRAWAEGVMTRPLWLETAATSIEWICLTGTVALIVFSYSEPFPIDRAALALLTFAPVIVSIALAMAVWERRTARRTLQSLAP